MSTHEVRKKTLEKDIKRLEKKIENLRKRIKNLKHMCIDLGIEDPDTYTTCRRTTRKQWLTHCDYKAAVSSLQEKAAKLEDVREELMSIQGVTPQKPKEDTKEIYDSVVESFLWEFKKVLEKYYRTQVAAIHGWKRIHKAYREETLRKLKEKYKSSHSHKMEEEAKRLNCDWMYERVYLKNHFTLECISMASYSRAELDLYLSHYLDEWADEERKEFFRKVSEDIGDINTLRLKVIKVNKNFELTGEVEGDTGRVTVNTTTHNDWGKYPYYRLEVTKLNDN